MYYVYVYVYTNKNSCLVVVMTLNYKDFSSRRFSMDKSIVLPYTRFSPVLSKSVKSRKQYDLSGLIISSNGVYCQNSTDITVLPRNG